MAVSETYSSGRINSLRRRRYIGGGLLTVLLLIGIATVGFFVHEMQGDGVGGWDAVVLLAGSACFFGGALLYIGFWQSRDWAEANEISSDLDGRIDQLRAEIEELSEEKLADLAARLERDASSRDASDRTNTAE